MCPKWLATYTLSLIEFRYRKILP